MRDTPEWRNWQTRLTQNQVLRSVGSSPTSGTNPKAAGKLQAFPPLFLYPRMPAPRATPSRNRPEAIPPQTQETTARP